MRARLAPMSIEIRTPTYDEWPDVCHLDGRAFGSSYTDEEIEQSRPLHDLGRFRVAFDNASMVAVAGSYALEVALPGGASVPMGGVTWVATAATNRRRGLMSQVVAAVHDDIDKRGEPVASLYASEGGIYERIGYGIATRQRTTVLDRRLTRLRPEYVTPPNTVRYLAGDDVVPTLSALWERFRRLRAGEIGRSPALQDSLVDQRSKPLGSQCPAAYLVHGDGYAVYRVEPNWNNGHPAHTMHLVEIAAITPEAHIALWQTLLSVDLVGEIRSRAIAVDDPLPFLLENQRALRTVELNDGVWVNVRDAAISFGARTYRCTDRLVVEVDARRWAIEGGPDGATCKAVRSRPDLVASHSALSALLYGGVLPSALVAGRRMTARDANVLRRADLFFPIDLAPHCQTFY